MKIKRIAICFLLMSSIAFLNSCDDDDSSKIITTNETLTVQNVLEAKPLVEAGTFKNEGAAPVYLPGESFSFQFSASKGQALTFATMYGWSNDVFFAPKNPGISLYDDNGNPIEGDVSNLIKLWDNGTRINQTPGENVTHPGTAETTPLAIKEINGTDDQGNSYAAASQLMHVTLTYQGNSIFKVTVENTSGNTNNPTPFSPGVWAVSYIAGGNLLDDAPLYKEGQLAVNGITNIAEMGDNSVLASYTQERVGIFTPISPILVVVYKGIDNPIFTEGEVDPGHGLTNLAQTGNANDLAAYLKDVNGVKNVYILPATDTTILLPMINGTAGSEVMQALEIAPGDKIAMATMYGLSNDWFFATKGEIEATKMGDLSTYFHLYDDGTAVNQLPGAGINQVNLGGTIVPENKPITEVANPNEFTTLPSIDHIIKANLN
ncbi:spondin domain-containing protein [Zhouia sp. PK063]|uniref:spondin domain-containing protein n=1 Tax=Zhouia sp. PK063 TaxID=3373602 RepID=UPI0037AFEF83